ncbi:MAG TPA: LON peptidase substrate-binding domain-containing protein, partial [Isosphaeraceae bacterium]|nr:LON peptidase substrate-binding domain-containing protein [Isosphaeraceae bacterium]
MRSRKKSPSAARSKRGLQVVSGRGGSRRVPEGSDHALALKDSSDPSIEHPNRLPLLPLRSDVVFPQTVVPLVINRPSGIRLVDDVLIGERLVGLVSQLHPEVDEPGMTDLYP